MAQKKKITFLHLKLMPQEEMDFKQKLREKDLKGIQVLRALVRKWIRE